MPVLWLIYLSLKSNTDILTNPLALPDTLHWENYVNAYKTIPFYSMVKNTGIVILISVPVSMLLSIFAAFALGRMRFGSGKVQNGVYSYFVCGVIMPTCVMILPIYLVMVKVGLYDTLWSTILTHIGWTAPMNMMIMVSGFRSIPDSLEEAAIIDGCSIWQLLFRILVPVAKPVISTALIMTFLACWNDFPLAKIMLNSPDVRTLSIAAAYFKGHLLDQLRAHDRGLRHPDHPAAADLHDLPALHHQRRHRRRRQGLRPRFSNQFSSLSMQAARQEILPGGLC